MCKISRTHLKFSINLLTLVFGALIVGGCGSGSGEDRAIEAEPVTIQGTLSLPSYYQLDWDTPTDRRRSNNRIDQAQTLRTPANLTGHLDATDTADYYRIQLNTNSRLFFEAQHESLDAAIEVVEVNSAAPASQTFLVVSPAGALAVDDLKGDVVLNVHRTNADTTNQGSYQLSLTNIPPGFATRALNIKTPKQPTRPAEEVILGFYWDQAPLSQQETLVLELDEHTLNLTKLEQAANIGRYRIEASGDLNWSDQMARLLIERLLQLPEVRLAEFNQRVVSNITAPVVVPNDPGFQDQWYLEQLKVPAAWTRTLGSSVVDVAIIDTGIQPHPDLPNIDQRSYDFISDPAFSNDGNGADNDPTDMGDRNSPDQPNTYHGTHVAGLIAASTNNGFGVAGVNQAVSMIHLRVLGEGGGTVYDLSQAIAYAAGFASSASAPLSEPVDILNLSLSTAEPTPLVANAIEAAHQRGVIVVASTGNESANQISFPASMDLVFAVGATGVDQSLASYSNRGAVDLVAPGGDFGTGVITSGVLSTGARDTGSGIEQGYAAYQGTSVATALTSGVFALMKSVHPDLSSRQITALLQAGALTLDLGAAGYDSTYGYGLLQADKAVAAADALAQTTHVPHLRGAYQMRLIDASNDREVSALTVQENTGVFAFEFSDIRPGDYQVQAGQDLNGNGILCEPEAFELCSTFTTIIPVQSAITGLFIEMAVQETNR